MKLSRVEQILQDFIAYEPFGHLKRGERFCIQDIQQALEESSNDVKKFSAESSKAIEVLQTNDCDTLLAFLCCLHDREAIILSPDSYGSAKAYLSKPLHSGQDLPKRSSEQNKEQWLKTRTFHQLSGDADTLLSPIEKEDDTIGWEFSGPKEKLLSKELEPSEISKIRELNIFFLGTGAAPLFTGHNDVYEGGDLLCNQAIQKGLDLGQPAIIVKGVGTAKMTKNQPLAYSVDEHAKTAGGMAGIALGYGLSSNLILTMEKFCIPKIIALAHHKKDRILINIVGHSRGAITAFAMSDFIDKWFKQVKTFSRKLFESVVEVYQSSLKNLSWNEIMDTLEIIREMEFEVSVLAYDPVEGALPAGDKCLNSRFSLELSGFETISVSYAEIPESVTRAKVCLAESERRSFFRPTIPKFSLSTVRIIKPVIGAHSTMVGFLNDNSCIKGRDAHCPGVPDSEPYVFIQAASRASIDLRKINDNLFLFRDKLPPLQLSTLHNAYYANNGQGYPRTKACLLEQVFSYVNNNKTDRTFKNYLFKLMDLPGDKFSDVTGYIEELGKGVLTFLDDKQLVELTQWITKQDEDINTLLYAVLEADIYEIYLSPKELKRVGYLSQWQTSMKKDTTKVVDQVSLSLEETEKPREYYLFEDNAQLSGPRPIKYLCSDMLQVFTNSVRFPFMSIVGGEKHHAFFDYYFDVLTIIQEAKLISKSKEALENIQLALIKLVFSVFSCSDKNYDASLKNFISIVQSLGDEVLKVKLVSFTLEVVNFILGGKLRENDYVSHDLLIRVAEFRVTCRLGTMLYSIRHNTFSNFAELVEQAVSEFKQIKLGYESSINSWQNVSLYQECQELLNTDRCSKLFHIAKKLNDYISAVDEYNSYSLEYNKSYKLLHGPNPNAEPFRKKMVFFKKCLKKVFLDNHCKIDGDKQSLFSLSPAIDTWVEGMIQEIGSRFYGTGSTFKSKLLLVQKKYERIEKRLLFLNWLRSTVVTNGTRSSFSNAFYTRIEQKLSSYILVIKSYEANKRTFFTSKNASLELIKEKLNNFQSKLIDDIDLKRPHVSQVLLSFFIELHNYIDEAIYGIKDQNSAGKSTLRLAMEAQCEVENGLDIAFLQRYSPQNSQISPLNHSSLVK